MGELAADLLAVRLVIRADLPMRVPVRSADASAMQTAQSRC
jgi:hypothetical protein